ncbi:bifunctional phosphopantothenoylcysteine decarboxylase/phosphopantothenate--cysteine ligase CoaBC [Putridiphycobacter roseus]|uniref:bifunctional phosphopantothenoylcysteine decarboxylase/phosphopantothenate--cysteine ligase CoaBC n=1 Tax=Putridiphycobacter roseus TaxID=2219161 RepID=UPI0029372E2E|nr:bifunctional phosphopantothenoylcysteine decarboxylase/phosphopantothenate--cysteine ligase CoaBC [Putridiphycobacter roseus]
MGKKILVGVTGSIAAYKTAILVRELIKLEAEVKVIMTPASTGFITPLTLATLSKNPVSFEFVKNENGEWENHVELGLWADLFIIAPLTANTLSKLASGQADNLLLATYLSARCPVWVAPAMDLDMFKHGSTTENLNKLSAYGNKIIAPTAGALASGLEGKGRMEEPEQIAAEIVAHFSIQSNLKGKKILITGGPTYESIDPVRFIGNHSSGKTGVILADECANRGAAVTLVLGPSIHSPLNPAVNVIRVTTAADMFKVVQANWSDSSIGIFSAAVADYRPANMAIEKIKKKSDEMSIDLVKNPDILAWAGTQKTSKQYLVGFALETNNEIENARGKLDRKNLDLLVLNSLRDKNAGFGYDTNKVTFIKPNNILINFELKQKSLMAKDILNEIETDFTA